jgi:subtilase family serine protease
MKVIFEFRGGLCPLLSVVGAVCRQFGSIVLSELLLITLFLVTDSRSAKADNVELSPLVTKSTLVSPLEESKQISVMLTLASSDPTGLSEFVHHVSTPSDPLYRQYLTPQKFAQAFGGNPDAYAYLKSWAANNGLQVAQESASRINLVVRGSVSQFQRIFQTQIYTYRAPDGETFYSAGIKPSVPIEIASRVSGVIGLTSGKAVAAHARVAKVLGENPAARSDKMSPDAAGGTGPGGTYSAKDLRNIYSIPTFGNLSKNTVIAVFEQGGYSVKDTDEYFKKNNLRAVKETPIAVDNSPIEVEQTIEVEACLDVDTIVGINPEVAQVLVYIDDYNNEPFNVAMPAAISKVADDNLAQILSISYGQDEDEQGSSAMDAENTALQQCAAEGITVLASSGDDGAYGDNYSWQSYNVSDPASQPYITGVGGTTLFTSPKQEYITEVAWDELDNGYGATGGGISSYWSIPSYQTADLGFDYMTGNGGSGTWRNVPDIAALGDPLTGVAVYVKDQGGWVQVGGTSLACPIWAGYLSTINAAFSYAGIGNLGFVNPALYAVGGSGFPSDYLYDITQGSNGSSNYLYYGYLPGYFNGNFYSNTTGNGSIWGGGFASLLLISQTQPGTPPRVFWFTTEKVKRRSVEVSWANSVGAAAYVIVLSYPGTYGWNIAESFVTKATKLTIDGLMPNTVYTLAGLSFNASGYNGTGGIQFQTPK